MYDFVWNIFDKFCYLLFLYKKCFFFFKCMIMLNNENEEKIINGGMLI